MGQHADSEVAEALRHAAAQLGRDLSRTASDAREAAKDLAGARGRTVGDAALERTERASEALGARMHRNPGVWLATAFAAGAVAALLLSKPRA